MHEGERGGLNTKAAAGRLKNRKGTLAVADHREDKAEVGQVNWLL